MHNTEVQNYFVL